MIILDTHTHTHFKIESKSMFHWSLGSSYSECFLICLHIQGAQDKKKAKLYGKMGKQIVKVYVFHLLLFRATVGVNLASLELVYIMPLHVQDSTNCFLSDQGGSVHAFTRL